MLYGVGWHAFHIRLMDGSDRCGQDAPASNSWLPLWSLLTQPLTLNSLGLPGLATQSEKFPEKAPGKRTCLPTDTQIHTQIHTHNKRIWAWKVGIEFPLTNYLHPCQYQQKKKKLYGPCRRWVVKWKVRTLHERARKVHAFSAQGK